MFPSKTMKDVLDHNCDYRRYCWNKALALWNDLYSAHTILNISNKVGAKNSSINPSPNWRLVRDRMVAEKEDWEYSFSSRILQLAVEDLGKDWKNFFNKSQLDWGKPKFKSKHDIKQSFKSDQVKLVGSKLVLDKPRAVTQEWEPIKMSETPLTYPVGVMSFYRENERYFVAIPYKIPKEILSTKSYTGKVTGVDINVGHFNYFDGKEQVLPKKLNKYYDNIRYYQRLLAKKRNTNNTKQGYNSKKYLKTRTKLQATYKRVTNIQNDLLQKFTTKLVNDYDVIVIENLDTKKMLMAHIASKGIHRSMFSKFRQILTYKCDWYGRELIIANKFYPSTQRCAVCGTIKRGEDRITLKGNKKYHTKHNEYICYNHDCPNYNKKVDRDVNAMLNLTLLASHSELNKAL